MTDLYPTPLSQTTAPPVIQEPAAALDRVVQNFSLEQLEQSDLNLWEIVHWLALDNWLSDVPAAPAAIATPADAIPLVEACHHSCTLGMWDAAYRLATRPVGSPTRPLHEALGQWGQYNHQIELYAALLERISPEVDRLCLNGLGQAYCYLGNGDRALGFHQRQLALAAASGDLAAQADAYGKLGAALHEQFRYNDSLTYYQQQYSLATQANQPALQASALYRMGHIHTCEQRTRQGKVLLEQALAIAQTLQDSALEAKITLSMGFNYLWNNQPVLAIPFFEQGRAQAQQLQDPLMALEASRNLGQAHILSPQSNVDAALALWLQALDQSQSLKLLHWEEMLLTDLALLYTRYRPDPDQGIAYMERAIALLNQREPKDSVLAFYTARLAWLYLLKPDLEAAHTLTQQALHHYRAAQLNDPGLKLLILGVIAKRQWLQKRFFPALWNLARCLWISPPWRSTNGKILLQEAYATLLRPILQRFRQQS